MIKVSTFGPPRPLPAISVIFLSCYRRVNIKSQLTCIDGPLRPNKKYVWFWLPDLP